MPRLVVLSSLFPSRTQPGAGIFIRERMFRVAHELELCVISPQPWFPGQGLIRRFIPGYRPSADTLETQTGIEVFRPRFLALPGIGRRFDSLSMALASLPLLRRLQKAGRCDVLDAHFAYPDGVCAAQLGRWLNIPVSVTLRGTEPRHLAQPGLRGRILSALKSAARVFAVSDSLRQLVVAAGVPAERVLVVGNGVDSERFQLLAKDEARAQLGLPPNAHVLITVGGLVERKGFHRVIEHLPELRREFPNLVYLVVGGPSPEGDWSEKLRTLAGELGVEDIVHFLGPLKADELCVPLSASDVFVLASSNEGWANVILEAMACGCPVVASAVGGNAEVVCDTDLGAIFPFPDSSALLEAMRAALKRQWDRDYLRAYARQNSWDSRVETLVREFRALHETAIAGHGVATG